MEMARESICKCLTVAGKPGLTGSSKPPLASWSVGTGEEGLAGMALVYGHDLPSRQVGQHLPLESRLQCYIEVLRGYTDPLCRFLASPSCIALSAKREQIVWYRESRE